MNKTGAFEESFSNAIDEVFSGIFEDIKREIAGLPSRVKTHHI